MEYHENDMLKLCKLYHDNGQIAMDMNFYTNKNEEAENYVKCFKLYDKNGEEKGRKEFKENEKARFIKHKDDFIVIDSIKLVLNKKEDFIKYAESYYS